MKQTTYICNKCHLPIQGTVYRIFVGVIDTETDEVADEGAFYLNETDEADLCGICLAQIDEHIAKMLSKGTKTTSESKRGKRTVNIDMDKVIEMRNNGISLDNIAKEFGCSPQTVQNYLTKNGYYNKTEQQENENE